MTQNYSLLIKSLFNLCFFLFSLSLTNQLQSSDLINNYNFIYNENKNCKKLKNKTDLQNCLKENSVQQNSFSAGEGTNYFFIYNEGDKNQFFENNSEEKIKSNNKNRKNSNKISKAATENDLFLYKGIGASTLCIGSKAGVNFQKIVGIATATYVQVLEGKHDGLIYEISPYKKLDREKLFAGAEFQIVETAIKYCPDNIPKDIKRKVKIILRENNYQ
tara:strand:- start:383 stop:1036 length:654 start_codon:yes stop_codon:yes gene_type:complete